MSEERPRIEEVYEETSAEERAEAINTLAGHLDDLGDNTESTIDEHE